MSRDSIYEKLSEERKQLQANGEAPEWLTTGGYQLLKERYLEDGETPKYRDHIISTTAAQYLPEEYREEGYNWFMKLFWEGWLSRSTPVLRNMGTNRGMSVSCSGQYIGDSVDSFYSNLREMAILTKNGFGTSAYLGAIRPRGSKISIGGKASGVQPVFDDYVRAAMKIAQGGRRGAWAGYIEVEHPDFDEIVHYIENNPDDANIGWILTDKFIVSLDEQDPEMIRRYQKINKMKAVVGKGYYHFTDKANRLRPQMYVDHGLTVKASNLCSEIQLHSDEEHTYTCVLSSMNLVHYDAWKDTDAVFWATVFLDCVAEDFIRNGKRIPGLEKAVRFTEKGRALGLGVMGLHSLFQSKMIPFESADAAVLNDEIFSLLASESLRASQWMAKVLGEPEWCKGYGVRNTHRMAVAPTKSTALIMGGASEGINPDPAMVFTQTTPAGEISRVNPYLLTIMKERGVYNKRVIADLNDKMGSVQHVTWLSDLEKEVFKTAFEINQLAIISLASARQMYLDQGQSLNLFFDANEEEEYISYIHEVAFKDPFILALYYTYSQAGVQASKGECESCQ